MIHKLLTMLMAYSAMAGESFLDGLRRLAPGLSLKTEVRARRMGTRGQLGIGTVLAAFVLVVAAMVIILVVDKFDQSLGDPSSSSLSTASNDVLSGFSSMASLLEPLFLVAIGIVIIGLIRRVQQS
jgi:hypothetical protein